MERRAFLKQGAAAAALTMASGIILPACRRNLRSELMNSSPMAGGPVSNGQVIERLTPDGYQILYYASLAPSGHNSQPWSVKIKGAWEWIVGSDEDRFLKIVDCENRETLLSLGAFVENLVQAAGALGYAAETTVISKNRFDRDVVNIKLSRAEVQDIPLQRMVFRRTVKSRLLPQELRSEDVDAFSKLVDGHLFYFPRGSRHAEYMNREAVENYIVQSDNRNAIEELASWIRLKDKDAEKFRDGLTPEGMEINGPAGWYVRHFMDKEDLMTRSFAEKGIRKVEAQVREGGGWLVITSSGSTVKDLVETGRRFQRMALSAREKMIAIHPMTQALEEKQGRKKIRENHKPDMIPQFMLRVGYLDTYPEPVSLRRPVEWFVRG